MSILNEAFAQNQEMFWCTDDDRMKWLFKASFVSKAWKKHQQGLVV